jgi:hypothetical protein
MKAHAHLFSPVRVGHTNCAIVLRWAHGLAYLHMVEVDQSEDRLSVSVVFARHLGGTYLYRQRRL